MAAWANFYILTGGAAATLIGLMFIAITFGSKLVTQDTVAMVRSILSPITLHFAQTFLIACAALMPTNNHLIVGIVAIASTLIRLLRMPSLIKQMRKAMVERKTIETSDWILSVAIPVILYLFLISSAVAFLMAAEWSYFGIGLSVISLLTIGIVSSWDMLLWMASRIE
jgi:hypothetical protein